MIREVDVQQVGDAIADMLVKANKKLPEDVLQAIAQFRATETNALAGTVMETMLENVWAADELSLPVCQDTGMAVVFLKIGQNVHFTGGDLYTAVNAGVRRAYVEGLLRKSVVGDPLVRKNTDDNTPAVIHTEIVNGNRVEILVAPKGFGSENMSGICMLTPSAGREGVIKAVLEIVKKAGGNPCPPMVIGVGIGGDFEQCALLAKKALCRPLDQPNQNPFYAELEQELLQGVNALGIGPQGFGGDTTALGLNIETAPTHIAGLPVAVNIGCHVTRHLTAVL